MNFPRCALIFGNLPFIFISRGASVILESMVLIPRTTPLNLPLIIYLVIGTLL